jgi:hypothetical protein
MSAKCTYIFTTGKTRCSLHANHDGIHVARTTGGNLLTAQNLAKRPKVNYSEPKGPKTPKPRAARAPMDLSDLVTKIATKWQIPESVFTLGQIPALRGRLKNGVRDRPISDRHDPIRLAFQDFAREAQAQGAMYSDIERTLSITHSMCARLLQEAVIRREAEARKKKIASWCGTR